MNIGIDFGLGDNSTVFSVFHSDKIEDFKREIENRLLFLFTQNFKTSNRKRQPRKRKLVKKLRILSKKRSKVYATCIDGYPFKIAKIER